MPACDCGSEIDRKNEAGHYRDQCWDCIEAVAAEAEPASAENRPPAQWLRETDEPEGWDA